MRQGSNAEMAQRGDASDHRSPGWPVNGGPQTARPEETPEMTATFDAVSIRGRKVERTAPCGARLATSRTRLLGAPLYRRIEAQLRDDILAPWHLPLDEYDCTVERDEAEGSASYGVFIARSEESLTATFTHRETGAKIRVTGIWVNDDGEIVQHGTNYGDLTL